ncbi:MAG: rRNA pseudouridine synthase [Erysipelotrichaceae bacterium]|nr:rRNA pseudouridine synthase [Erysipelotrichaceae bacterium]
MRLDKFLADMTPYSRNDIKKLIRRGAVTVNGQQAVSGSQQVEETAEVFLDSEQISYRRFEYYLLNKPAGYICANYDASQPVAMELIDSPRRDLSCVGRLDKDTEGAILITNDGKLNHGLLTAANHVDKTYYAEFIGELPADAAEIMARGIAFKDFTSLPAVLEIIDDHRAYLTVHEGRFHQVRRMFQHLGCLVTYLRRDEFAGLTLEGLKCGQYRRLTEEEVDSLKQMSDPEQVKGDDRPAPKQG